jgi:hypothetical protein
MSDSDETQTRMLAVSESETKTELSVEPLKSRGATVSICDMLRELFDRAPKKALSWVCAGVAIFVVLSGVGVMGALLKFGWPTLAAKRMQNWELKTEAGKSFVELRQRDEAGEVKTEKVIVPVDVLDPKAWAVSRYGEQKPLTEMPTTSTNRTP